MTREVNSASEPFDFAVPRHVAIIMDGNGRWAKRRLLPRLEGHRMGAKTLRAVVEESRRLGVRYLTVYAFSTENWRRPADEVSGLMRLLEQYLRSEASELCRNGVRMRAVGDLARLPERVRAALAEVAEQSRDCRDLDLILALSYGGRCELVHAARRLSEQVRDGALRPEEIDEQIFARSLYAPDVPDPDLLIRTSGEQRISNFMLWQLAYAEIVVTATLWPDFSKADYVECLREFSRRARRYGLTGEQVVRSSREVLP